VDPPSVGADVPAGSQTRLLEPETGTGGPSAIGPGEGDAALAERVNASSPARRPMSAKERMARRRAELKRLLGLPAKSKGRLKDLVTPDVTPTPPDSVTPPENVTQPRNMTEVAR
jgi:hypothetical protein